jgi:Sporulation and spore germination
MIDPRGEDVLRRAMEAEAGQVEVASDALSVIRRRVAARRGWRRFLLVPERVSLAFGTGAALTATAVVVAVFVLVASITRSLAPNPPVAGGPSDTPSVLVSADEALAVPGGSVAVYYLRATPVGPLLYREFHPGVPPDASPADRAKAAVAEMLSRRAFDPDYTSPWPAGITVGGAIVEGDTVTVDLTGVPATTGLDAKTAAAAVQQLIWTASAARTGLTGVRLLFDGRARTTLWGVAVGGVLRRGKAADVRAPVLLIDPQQGVTVGNTFTVRVAGLKAEGTVRLRIRSASVLIGPQTVKLDTDGSAAVSFTVEPGRYTAEAFIEATDGSEQFVDDHEFTVA